MPECYLWEDLKVVSQMTALSPNTKLSFYNSPYWYAKSISLSDVSSALGVLFVYTGTKSNHVPRLVFIVFRHSCLPSSCYWLHVTTACVPDCQVLLFQILCFIEIEHSSQNCNQQSLYCFVLFLHNFRKIFKLICNCNQLKCCIVTLCNLFLRTSSGGQNDKWAQKKARQVDRW